MTDDELNQDLKNLRQSWTPNPNQYDAWLQNAEVKKGQVQLRHRALAACCGIAIAVFAFVITNPNPNLQVDPIYNELAEVLYEDDFNDDMESFDFIDEVLDTL